MSDAKTPRHSILLVDDEESILLGYHVALSRAGLTNTIRCSDSRKVMDHMRAQPVELVLLDLIMPHVSGEEILEQIVESYPDVPVIIVTGNTDVQSAVHCMKVGACDYLVKPVAKERLLTTVQNVLSTQELKRENARLRDKVLSASVQNAEAFGGMVTVSGRMHAAFAYVEAVAGTPHPVLLTGETGVGKELMARALHAASGRSGSFVSVNAAGLDDNMFADSLFGHQKGAFTGADSSRAGMIEEAAGGTLFLDEIGDLSLVSQVKLLRLLQENEYLPLGQDRPVRSDARIVVATNVDLAARQRDGAFRPDLYFRLRTHHIHIPPLRERPEDVPVLLDHYLGVVAESMGKKTPTYPPELLTLLAAYDFPGNVRELVAMVTDAVSRHQSRVLSLNAFREHIHGETSGEREGDGDVPAESAPDAIVFSKKLPGLKDAKRLLIDEALRRTNGNMSQAAELLGVTRQALSWHRRRG